MTKNSKIEWTDHTFNPWTGETNWKKPLQWAKAAQNAKRRPRVFCAFTDIFDNQVDPVWRVDLFDLIQRTPELDWLLLTKRPENILKSGMIPGSWLYTGNAWPNVWLGFTAENQEWFDRRWPVMAQIPAVVRFCSYEPAIGPLRIRRTSGLPKGLDWLICGGESGPRARMMDLQWARDVRDDCAEAGIKFFFKQTTGKGPIPADLMVREFPKADTFWEPKSKIGWMGDISGTPFGPSDR